MRAASEEVGDPRILAGAAGAVVLAALAHGGLEHLTGGLELGDFLQGKLLPAVLWAGAAPILVVAGARWPVELGERGRRFRQAARRLAVFGVWHLLVNVAIRLPDLPARGGAWLLGDTLEGAVRYAPAALLLFVLLLAVGQVARGRGRSREDRPARPPSPPPLILPGPNRVRRVPPPDVRWIEADGDHVVVHADGSNFRVRGTLKELQERLAPTRRFVRVHRSSLVNAERVREVQPLRYGDWVAVLDDGTELRIPRTRKAALNRLRNGERSESTPGGATRRDA